MYNEMEHRRDADLNDVHPESLEKRENEGGGRRARE